jgi:hypothetical protein
MTKGIYKPTFVFVVALIFILTALAAVSASERESESVSYLIGNPSTTINFEGTVLSDTSLIGARRFEVRIDNRISGPEPCKNPIVVEMQVGMLPLRNNNR